LRLKNTLGKDSEKGSGLKVMFYQLPLASASGKVNKQAALAKL